MHADAMEKFSILEGSQKAMSKSTTNGGGTSLPLHMRVWYHSFNKNFSKSFGGKPFFMYKIN